MVFKNKLLFKKRKKKTWPYNLRCFILETCPQSLLLCDLGGAFLANPLSLCPFHRSLESPHRPLGLEVPAAPLSAVTNYPLRNLTPHLRAFNSPASMLLGPPFSSFSFFYLPLRNPSFQVKSQLDVIEAILENCLKVSAHLPFLMEREKKVRWDI